MSTYFESPEFNVNTNNLGNSPAVSSTASSFVTAYIVPNTGSHSTHVIELQASPNGGTDWITISSITGVGTMTVSIMTDEVRLKVTTSEGSASTCKAYIFGV